MEDVSSFVSVSISLLVMGPESAVSADSGETQMIVLCLFHAWLCLVLPFEIQMKFIIPS